MGENIENFAAIMSSRMQDTVAASHKTSIDLATVDGGLSLVPDNFKRTIPKGSYLINLALTCEDPKIPEEFRSLEPGDRVLIVWVGSKPVVIAIIYQGE